MPLKLVSFQYTLYKPLDNLGSFTVLAWVYHEVNYQYGDVLFLSQGGESQSGKGGRQ